VRLKDRQLSSSQISGSTLSNCPRKRSRWCCLRLSSRRVAMLAAVESRTAHTPLPCQADRGYLRFEGQLIRLGWRGGAVATRLGRPKATIGSRYLANTPSWRWGAGSYVTVDRF
jgi:hypothetical protein